MAILAQENAEISGGFSKEIDDSAKGLMFDILQQHQYQFPIKSTVREIVSNGLDSISEKHIAKAILSGKSKVEDFFVEREGDIYKNSKFNPEYYNLDYLSDNDYVTVTYEDGGEMGKDYVIIKDNGVGLGAKRLEGYFNLGFSSKRLLSKALGKFGIGAKAPLSVGVPFYTITSRWNGMEFCFNVYAHRVESLVPQFDLETMIENPSYEFGNGYKCYYKRTSEKNMLEIKIAAKKHHKQQYLDAVTSQLLYFKNIYLQVTNEGGSYQVPVQADILYEDDLIVLANNSSYSRPHILLNGVNYGYVNFQELELEDKTGSIGIKLNPDLVSVNPSRESLIWDDKTREVVVNRFNEVVTIAQEIINKELKETDFIKWMRLCASASTHVKITRGQTSISGIESTIVGRLANVVDMTKIELSYPLNSKIRFNTGLTTGISIRRVFLDSSRNGSKIKKKIEYAKDWKEALTESLPVYVTDKILSNRKNKWLLQKHPAGFIIIQLQLIPENGVKVLPTDIEQESDDLFTGVVSDESKFKVANIHNYILASTDGIMYNDIEVPENFKGNDEDEEEIAEETNIEAIESAVERRKITGKTILHTPRKLDNYKTRGSFSSFSKLFEMQKVEFTPDTIDTWKNEEIFWSNQDYEPLLHTVALITRHHSDLWNTDNSYDSLRDSLITGTYGVTPYNSRLLNNFYDDSKVRLLKVAQQNVKYYKDFKHITKFFKEIKNKTITMSNALIRWNTARLLQQKLEDLRFLNGFSSVSETKAEQYKILKNYVDDYWRDLRFNASLGSDDTTQQQLISHLDKVGQFQLFVKANATDTESIAQLAKELFNPENGVEITDGCAIDLEIYNLYLELLDWAQPVKTLMNIINPLIYSKPITVEEQEEILNYFKYRGVSI